MVEGISMGVELSDSEWTVVARRGVVGQYFPVHCWLYEPSVSAIALRAASDDDRVILMHRHTGKNVEMVARLAGPKWRRMLAQRARL